MTVEFGTNSLKVSRINTYRVAGEQRSRKWPIGSGLSFTLLLLWNLCSLGEPVATGKKCHPLVDHKPKRWQRNILFTL